MKPVEVDIKMTFADMYRFNLYHAYHHSQGILSIVLAVMLVALSILTWNGENPVYNVIYLLAAVFVACYVPLSLRASVKKQMSASDAYREPIHYTFDEEGVTTSFKDQSATMPWKQMYKIVSTKRMVLLYGGRIRANVIPRDQLGEAYNDVYELARAGMDANRFKMKKESPHDL